MASTKRLTATDRARSYRTQNSGGVKNGPNFKNARELTPAQKKRIKKKANKNNGGIKWHDWL